MFFRSREPALRCIFFSAALRKRMPLQSGLKVKYTNKRHFTEIEMPQIHEFFKLTQTYDSDFWKLFR